MRYSVAVLLGALCVILLSGLPATARITGNGNGQAKRCGLLYKECYLRRAVADTQASGSCGAVRLPWLALLRDWSLDPDKERR